jgi:hypothetical protein
MFYFEARRQLHIQQGSQQMPLHAHGNNNLAKIEAIQVPPASDQGLEGHKSVLSSEPGAWHSLMTSNTGLKKLKCI